MSSDPLSSLDANEFYDAYRALRPDASREDFEMAWVKFQEAKATRARLKALQ